MSDGIVRNITNQQIVFIGSMAECAAEREKLNKAIGRYHYAAQRALVEE